MFKQLTMLLKLRAWLKSDTLKAGGVIGVLGALQAFFSSQDGIDLLAMLAGVVHISAPTLGGVVLGLIGIAVLVMRAITERSLAAKVADPPK